MLSVNDVYDVWRIIQRLRTVVVVW